MLHQERKYRVDSFRSLKPTLRNLGATPDNQHRSTHYYTAQPIDTVVKLVVSDGNHEIHVLKGFMGEFSLTKKISVSDTESGLAWLTSHGHELTDKLDMVNTNYSYQDGLVGLYIINDSLHSVILDFPEGHHDSVAKELGIEDAETITFPYNEYIRALNA